MTNPMNGKPLSGEAHESMKRKIDLILAVVGTDTDSELTARTYALMTLTIKVNVYITSVLSNLIAIYVQVDTLAVREGDEE